MGRQEYKFGFGHHKSDSLMYVKFAEFLVQKTIKKCSIYAYTLSASQPVGRDPLKLFQVHGSQRISKCFSFLYYLPYMPSPLSSHCQTSKYTFSSIRLNCFCTHNAAWHVSVLIIIRESHFGWKAKLDRVCNVWELDFILSSKSFADVNRDMQQSSPFAAIICKKLRQCELLRLFDLKDKLLIECACAPSHL